MSLLFKIFDLSVRNLRANFRYFATGTLTLSAVFCGLSLFQQYMIDTIKLVSSVFQERFMLGDVVISPSLDDTNIDPLSQEAIERFFKKKSNLISSSTPTLKVNGLIKAGKITTIFLGTGYKPVESAIIRGENWAWDTIAGHPLNINENPYNIVIGTRLADILGCETDSNFESELSGIGYKPRIRPFTCPHKEVEITATSATGNVNTIPVTIVGIIDGVWQELDTRILFFSIEAAQELIQTDDATSYSVKINDTNRIDDILDDFKKELGTDRQLEVVAWNDAVDAEIFRRLYDNLRIFRGFIVSVLISIICISIFYTFQKAVNERRLEIGILRSMGFRPTHITSIFIVEAAIMNFAGCLVGLILSLIVTTTVNSLGIQYQVGGLNRTVPFTVATEVWPYLFVGAIMLPITVLGAFIAVSSQLRKPPSENLRLIQ